MKNIFTLGMCTTQLSESFNRGLKAFLKSDLDVVRFFHHFERVLNQKCEREIESVYDMRKKQPRLKVNVLFCSKQVEFIHLRSLRSFKVNGISQLQLMLSPKL
jgi:hypothetical protein